MTIKFETIESIIESSSYSSNGSETEKVQGNLLSELFPNSEIFWKHIIVPFTNRIDTTITDYQKSIMPRDGIAEILHEIGAFHYTIFHNFIYAEAALAYRQPSFFENFYTHLGSICDCAEEFLINVYFLILDCTDSGSTILKSMTEDEFLVLAKKWYEKNYLGLYDNYLSKGKTTKINIPTRSSVLDEYFEGATAWKGYVRFSQGIRQFRNVIVHNSTIAFFLDINGNHFVPKKEVIGEYKRWRDLEKAKNDQKKLEAHFILREFQMVQDLQNMKKVLQDLWEKPINDLKSLFLVEKNEKLLKKYNLTLMESKKEDLVWYACYGSNIDEGRFLKYLKGGTLPTIGRATKEYEPCPGGMQNPVSARSYILHQKLIFALKSQTTWAGHGVGFIGNKKDGRIMTYAKIYLISRNQFNYLFANENGRDNVTIDYATLHKDGKLDFNYGFYSRLVLLENSLEGYPVYTFTNKGTPEYNAPCKEYVQYIANGIIDTHKPGANELIAYFGKLKTGFSKADLKNIIEPLYKK